MGGPAGGDVCGRQRRYIDARQNPFFNKRGVAVVQQLLNEGFGLGDQPVVLGVENVVDGGEADVLVDATVASDEVRIEQLVVVDGILSLGVGNDSVAGDGVTVGYQRLTKVVEGRGVMRHVVDEGGTSADVLRRIGVVGVLRDIGGYRDMVDVEATGDALDRAFDGRR